MDIFDIVLGEVRNYVKKMNESKDNLAKAGRALMKLSYENIGDEGYDMEALEGYVEKLEKLQNAPVQDEKLLSSARSDVVSEIGVQLGVINEMERRAIRQILKNKAMKDELIS